MSSNGKSQWMLDRLGRFLTGPDQPPQHSSNTPGLGGPDDVDHDSPADLLLEPEEGVGPVHPFDASSLLRASEQWEPPAEAEDTVQDDAPASDDEVDAAEETMREADPASEPLLEPQVTIAGQTTLIPPADITFDPTRDAEPDGVPDPDVVTEPNRQPEPELSVAPQPEPEPTTSTAPPLVPDTESEPPIDEIDPHAEAVDTNDEVVEVVVPVIRDGVAVVEPLTPPENDEELEAALARDLGAEFAWLDDERFDIYHDPDVVAADDATDKVLEAIARADAEALLTDADCDADDAPETESDPSSNSAPSEDQGLDAAIQSLRVVPVSGPGLALLPADAITTEVTDTITGAVATVAPGSVDFLTEDRCDSWSITAGMATSVAETNTRELGDVTADLIEVHGVQVTVVESSLPIAVSALPWLEDFVDTPLPVGSLVFAPSPHLLVIQATAARSPRTSETLMNFVRAESNPPHALLGPVLFQQTLAGLEVVSELDTAAGRLTAIAATS